MHDPLKHKSVRIVVEVQNDRGEWLDAAVIPLERRGPDNAFSTGAVGYYAGTNVSLHDRPGRVNFSFTESGSKGFGTPRVKGDPSERKAMASSAVESFYTRDEQQAPGRTRRTA